MFRPRLQQTAKFNTLLPLLPSQLEALHVQKGQHVKQCPKLLDNHRSIRWCSFMYQHYSETFVQQLPFRNKCVRGKATSVDVNRVTYWFKSESQARSEVSHDSSFPGRTLRLEGNAEYNDAVHSSACANCDDVEAFRTRGFIQMDKLIGKKTVGKLIQSLDAVLAGKNDTGFPPDKRPSNASSSHVSPGQETMQVINIWKASREFAKVILSERLGRLVSTLAGWPHGSRLAQDQVWVKPPGAGPLVFHRDSTYFDFDPADVVTVWLALDCMEPELGPLEYVPGSHLWGDGRPGSAKLFFDKNRFALMHDAARKHGIQNPEKTLEVVRVKVVAGGGSIHNGRTWHGSGPNSSETQPRRGLGIHFVPAHAKFRHDEEHTGRLWRKYVHPDGSRSMSDKVFPVTYAPPS